MRALALALALLLGPSPGAAAFQANTAGGTADFLRVGAGARPLGMGEAYGAVAEGAEAMFWNPAGLAQLRKAQGSYTRSELLGYFHHDYAAYARPVRALGGAVGLSYTRLTQEYLPVVTNANQNIGRFTPHSESFALGYARSFDVAPIDGGERDYFGEAWTVPGATRPLKHKNEPWTGSLMAGLSAKYVYESYFNQHADTFAFDGGVIFRPEALQQLSMSGSFRNLGGKTQFDVQYEALPAEFDFGLAYDKRWWGHRFLPAVELGLPYYGVPFLKTGAEYTRLLSDRTSYSVRAGYKTQAVQGLGPIAGITFGVGFKYRGFNADFGFQPMAELGQTYRFTVGYSW